MVKKNNSGVDDAFISDQTRPHVAHLTPTQSISTQPNTTQPHPIHPIHPTGANPTLPNVPEDRASENRQLLIPPRVDREVEVEMDMRVGKKKKVVGGQSMRCIGTWLEAQRVFAKDLPEEE